MADGEDGAYRISRPVGQSHWGRTQFKTKTAAGVTTAQSASELFVKQLDGNALGAVAFHECRHAKLLEGDGMHKKGGLAAATVTASSALNNQNRTDMANNIARKITSGPMAGIGSCSQSNSVKQVSTCGGTWGPDGQGV